ncbi:MAG: FeoB-associated Cys-rich membrane protein [Clostridiales bacterium]|nr:FeoB-associated Cys-rich membrane protein [Clostridiales bacterium]HAW15706.1 FeoB-associated Cys-rich membrane protein [Clostridiales bacterium]
MILSFLKDNAGTIIAATVVLVILFFAVRGIFKNSKNGGCGCGCSSCSGACPHCIPPVNKEDKNEVN